MRRTLLMLLFSALPAVALGTPNVPPAYRAIATAQGVPPALLYAVALTESGRALPNTTELRPWPWSVNFGGRGQYFESRQAARQAIETYLASGQRSVDIGLMQISWRYHQANLGTVWRALDPHHNVVEAARILNACRDRHTDWWSSVGCYHAPSDPQRAARYQARVRAHWLRLEP